MLKGATSRTATICRAARRRDQHAFAKRAWPGKSVGKLFTTPNTPTFVTVIGIVGDAKRTATEAAMLNSTPRTTRCR